MITAPTKWPSEQTAMTMSNSCTNKRPPKANSCEHFLRCQTTVSLHPKHKIQLLAPSTKADSKDQQEEQTKDDVQHALVLCNRSFNSEKQPSLI